MNIDSVQLNFNQDNLWILNACLALVMLGVSLELKIADFKRIAKTPKATVVGLISQFILLPAFTFLLVVVIEPPPTVALGMILVAACPGGNISNFITHLAKGNTALSVTLTAFGTVLAIIMTPLNLELWGSLYPSTSTILKSVSLNTWDVFKAIVLLAGLPLSAGMLFNHYQPHVANILAKKLKPVSILIFVGFVVLALANNFSHFINYIHVVLLIVLVHNALAVSVGFLTARVTRLDFTDQKTIAIETGIQNSGLGLLLIFSFFNGIGGMAIIAAWWGIWHIVSGLTLSFFWSKAFIQTHPVT